MLAGAEMSLAGRRGIVRFGALGLSALALALGWLATTAEAQAKSRILPVWVFLDGDLPVSYGRVAVVPTTDDPAHVGDRRPLRQRNGKTSERTNAAGVALLHFARLPERFTIVVRGGGSDGEHLRGTLYAEVTDYGADTDVIEVNPVTTLTAHARTAGRGMRAPRARRKVKQMLGLPPWHNFTSDLRHSDERFDGDAYQDAAERRGSVLRLNRRLVAEVRDGDRDRRRFRESRAEAAAALDWLALIAAPEKLIPKVFGEIANYAVGKVEERAKQGLLGWLTKVAVDLGLTTPERDQLEEIQGALEALGKQLARLEGQVEGIYAALADAELTQLAHQTDTTLGRIDHAQTQLATLAHMSPSDPTAANFARMINDYIGSRLLDAPAILNRALSPNIPLTDNVVKVASKVVVRSTPRVFDARRQRQVTAIYNYFAAYQAQLAILLGNYWHSKPDTYSPETIQRSLAEIQNNVSVDQRTSLKPAVPGGTWVDPSTGLMWTFTDTPVDGVTLRESYVGKTNLAVAGFANWRLPSSDELVRHTNPMAGGARAYLNAQLGFEDAVVRNTWTADSLTTVEFSEKPPWRPYITYLAVRIFDLNANQFVDLKAPGSQYDYSVPPERWPLENVNTPAGQAWLRAKVARGLFYIRQPSAREDYWWGAARAGG